MIYLKDSYTKSFEEKILLVEGDKIITQDSSFYAQSGGQPGDKGVLEINDKKFNVIRNFPVYFITSNHDKYSFMFSSRELY